MILGRLRVRMALVQSSLVLAVLSGLVVDLAVAPVAGARSGQTTRAAALGVRVVVVPRVRGSVFVAYKRLREAGLRVSIPAGLTIDTLAPPRVVRVSPAPGRRVARGSVVVLSLHCCVRAAARGRTRAAKSYVLPLLLGWRVRSADLWAQRRRLPLTLYLLALRAGDAPDLLENYEVSAQDPSAGQLIGPSRMGAGGTSGYVHRLMLYGAQRPRTPCDLPQGTVLLRTLQAVLTELNVDSNTNQLYGCSFAVGKQRLLATSVQGSQDEVAMWSQLTLAGGFAALILVDQGVKYHSCTSSIVIADLNRGTSKTPYSGGCPSISSLQLNSSGFAVWHSATGSGSTVNSVAISDVSCPSVSLCVAVDGSGQVLSSGNPSGGAKAWKTVPAQVANQAIACPTTELCVSVTGNEISTSTDPTGPASAWTTSQISATGLFGVTCFSASFCVAVGNSYIATTTNPTGGPSAWNVTTIPGQHDFFGVSCPSLSLCVVVDSQGGDVVTSTDPTGGPSAWQVAQIDPHGFISSVSCPSVSLCVAPDASGYVLTSTNPTAGTGAWNQANINGGFLTRASCPSTGLCVSGSLSGIASSTNPTGGSAAWNSGHIPNTNDGFTGVSCPSVSMCVAAGKQGDIATTSNPSAGPSAWNAQQVDAPTSTPPSITESIYAFDSQGTITLDSAGPGSGTALTGLQLAGNTVSWTDNGTPKQTTLR